MNYKEHYDNLIQTRKDRVLTEGTYYEKHHIIMRSMGGTNDENNLVRLTAREHFIAHRLLWMIYKNRQTAWAFKLMCSNNKSWSSKIYTELRKELKHSAETKIKISKSSKDRLIKTDYKMPSMLGRTHSAETKIKIGKASKDRLTWPNYKMPSRLGSKHSTESKIKMSIAHKGSKGPTFSLEMLEKMSVSRIGIKFSDEHKKNLSIACKGRKPWNLGKSHVIESNKKIICQYDLCGNIIKEWHSGKEASLELNISRSGISQCCTGKFKTFAGFIWKHKNINKNVNDK